MTTNISRRAEASIVSMLNSALLTSLDTKPRVTAFTTVRMKITSNGTRLLRFTPMDLSYREQLTTIFFRTC